jgi:hypothetical protein
VVDPHRLSVVRTVPRVGAISGLAWLTPRRALAVGYDDLAVIDLQRGVVVERRSLDALPYAVRRAGLALLLLLAPREGVGPARLLLVDASGRARDIALEEIPAGSTTPSTGGGQELDRPGLALATDGRRAWVVGDATVAEVALPSLVVSYHPLALRRPAAAAKGSSPGYLRQAVLVDARTLAVSGEDVSAVGDRLETRAAGLTLVDTRTWRSRRIAAGVTRVAGAGRLLLAFGGARAGQGVGLRGYAGGRPRFHLFGAQAVQWVEVAGGRAYTSLGPTILAVDLERGEVVGRLAGPMPQLLLGTMRES